MASSASQRDMRTDPASEAAQKTTIRSSGPSPARARRVDVRLEHVLVAEMLAGVADEPGALPLLQYALTELFDRRGGQPPLPGGVPGRRRCLGAASVLLREVHRRLTGVLKPLSELIA